MRHSSPRSSSDRIVNAASRGTIQTTDDAHLFQQVGLDGHSGEKHADVEHAQPYGLVSNVQPPTGTGSNSAAESFIVYMGGDRSHPVVLITGDRRYRLMNLQPGEVALHDDQGQQLHITRGGIVQTALNSQRHIHQIMPDKSSALNKDQGGGSGPTSKFGQTPWTILVANGKQAPFAFHAIDKDSRTIQHPATITHQVIDPKDAADPAIPSSKKKVIHSRTADQKKGVIDSVAEGKHTRTTDPTKGISDSVANGKHTRVIDAVQGIIDKTSAAHSRTAGSTITDTATQLVHNGPTTIAGTLGVSQLASFAGGLGTGALEVAPDSAGGLVQATKGLMVLLGLITDLLTFSGGLPNCSNDNAARLAGVAIGQLYRNGSNVQIRVT